MISILSLSLPLSHQVRFIWKQTIELKEEMVAIHEKRVRRCLSKIRGNLSLQQSLSFSKMVEDGFIWCRNRKGGGGSDLTESVSDGL